MFSQTQYTKAFNFTSMADNGFIYIPEYCNKNQCVVHIALHGCIQEFEAVGYAFVKNAGYNTWAESNNIIVIYP